MKLNEVSESPNRTRIVGGADLPPSQYIRGKGTLDEIIRLRAQKFDNLVDSVIYLFAKYNYLVADSLGAFDVDTQASYRYREYNRDIQNDFTGKLHRDEYEELKQSIADKGILEPLRLKLIRLHPTNSIEVYVGEGNHRLKIAKELNLPTVPVVFNYVK